MEHTAIEHEGRREGQRAGVTVVLRYRAGWGGVAEGVHRGWLARREDRGSALGRRSIQPIA
jgi:hypothetical protein